MDGLIKLWKNFGIYARDGTLFHKMKYSNFDFFFSERIEICIDDWEKSED